MLDSLLILSSSIRNIRKLLYCLSMSCRFLRHESQKSQKFWNYEGASSIHSLYKVDPVERNCFLDSVGERTENVCTVPGVYERLSFRVLPTTVETRASHPKTFIASPFNPADFETGVLQNGLLKDKANSPQSAVCVSSDLQRRPSAVKRQI